MKNIIVKEKCDMDEIQIIPFYAHPHVFVVINDNTFYDEAVGTPQVETMPYATAIVTGADSGRDNTFIRCDDLTKKRAIFGKANYRKYGQSSLQADVLFNGSTSVWFYRALPDDATYANMIILQKFRKGDVLNDLGQPTGLKRLETKFDVVYAVKPDITYGARDDEDMEAVAESYASETADPETGYMCLPIGYARIDGHGKYGNKYAVSVSRDIDAEKEYEEKMYAFTLYKNDVTSRISNIFSGALYQQAVDNVSTLIDDVMTKFDDGTCPLFIKTFEDNFLKIYDFYKEIVEENANYIAGTTPSDDEVADLEFAEGITERTFDPIFGFRYLTRSDEIIPYYQNYTAGSDAYVAPDKEVDAIANRPDNTADWNTAAVGNTVLVVTDSTHDNLRWQYTVTAIGENGAITYDEGVQVAADADQFDGIDLTVSGGIALKGGSDGLFETVTSNGVTRAPSEAEMKLLLAREQVKAFRGLKDPRIKSPYRIWLDFIFDANYNMTSGDDTEGLNLEDSTRAVYGNSTVLTDADYRSISVLGAAQEIDTSDINVKEAIYDLISLRNKNGMPNAPDEGAGCSVHFDCGLVGMKSATASSELNDIIDAFDKIRGRAFSIDLGYYTIFDPNTGRKVPVTVAYFIAQNMIPFILTNGLNAPFVFNKASLVSVQNNDAYAAPGSMIRDSFKPDIDNIDWDVKEKLYNSRINYWVTTDEGRYIQRACQNTRQLQASELLEENNTRVLNALKKGLEAAARGYLYGWNTDVARKGYTVTQMNIYRPWIGTLVKDLDIYFTANQFEETRMLMRCVADVEFFKIAKRISLVININRSNGGEA